MNYEVRPEEKGFTLIYRGVEVGTAKLHCDAVLIGKQLDKQFELEYHRGAKTLELMIERQKCLQEIEDMKHEVRAKMLNELERK